MRHIVIAGLGSAGYAALMAIRRTSPGTRITVIDPKPRDLAHPCGIPYALGGQVPADGLEQDIYLNKMGVKKISGRVLAFDGAAHTVTVAADGEHALEYDAAIITTGAVPVLPPIKGLESVLYKGLYPLATTDDLKKIKGRLDSSVHGIVIGAGAIGLEAAIALRKHLKGIAILEMRSQILPGVLDPDMTEPVREHLESYGIGVHTDTQADGVIELNGFGGVTGGGNKYEGETGILSAGFRANTEAAGVSGLALDPLGIVVDGRMRTSSIDIYAAGDCAANWSIIDGSRLPVKLATGAYRMGIVAGINAAGGDAEYRGTAGTFVTRIGNLEVAGTGYTTQAARAAGYTPVEGKIRTTILPDYFPENTTISIKVLCDRMSGRFLGAQAVAERGAAERVNLVSMALETGMLPADFWRVELAYCPAVSEVVDPLNKAIEFALRRMAR
ncbi:MAG TPA: FAD-dependent oxidoreductase [Spirochaetota bacterium]|nr:FAD-dependent oxidoreductase [Spirochaetota bacterium]OPZ39761.1 MAG: putative NADH oxidase [Spirochaetes bacterium ADurb.BinA120]HNU91433.1 FAD-dependent oxidoreductase [Spirochaetota bacterium]HPI14423.1 FAD-dependent oxidoreductase [Spirochaetota bacterium]HPV96699.1 FAD-dependent oxidoreductase [Spirochaetota bacterium]